LELFRFARAVTEMCKVLTDVSLAMQARVVSASQCRCVRQPFKIPPVFVSLCISAILTIDEVRMPQKPFHYVIQR